MTQGMEPGHRDPCAEWTTPGFVALVRESLRRAVVQQVDVQPRLRNFTPEGVVVISERLQRIFDPSLPLTLESSIHALLSTGDDHYAGWSHLPISLGSSLDTACNNHIYLFCIHLCGQEIAAIRRIRAETNSLSIGWLWDNHHMFGENIARGQELDICIPSHFYGRAILNHCLPAVCHPLPQCISQWSIPTLADLQGTSPSEAERSDVLFGRFTDWVTDRGRYGVGTRGRDLASLYGDRALDQSVQLILEPEDNYDYFTKDSRERYALWLQHKVSLCLPGSKELSHRFFDAIACGHVPIVDCDIDQRALTDLAPSLELNQAYVVADPADPVALLEAHSLALSLQGTASQEVRSRHVLQAHMVEHRLGLILGAVLEELQHQRQIAAATAWQCAEHLAQECLDSLKASNIAQATGLLPELLSALDRSRGIPDSLRRQQQIEAERGILLALLKVARSYLLQSEGDSSRQNTAAELNWIASFLPNRLRALTEGTELPAVVATTEEVIIRHGAMAWMAAAQQPEELGHAARRRAISLLCRLAPLHHPCPQWISARTKSLLREELTRAIHRTDDTSSSDDLLAWLDSASNQALQAYWEVYQLKTDPGGSGCDEFVPDATAWAPSPVGGLHPA